MPLRRAFPTLVSPTLVSLVSALTMVLVLSPATARKAEAHALAPSLLELTQADGSRFEVLFKTPAWVPEGSPELSPRLPAACRPLGSRTTRLEDTAAVIRWTVDCGEAGLEGGRLTIAGLAQRSSDALVRIRFADGGEFRDVLSGRRPSLVVPEDEPASSVWSRYLALGVEHILLGLDHLLFVLALVLLVRGGRALIATITAFTLGHSVTLAMASLGWSVLPAAVSEVAIAASLLVLAGELTRPEAAGTESRWRWEPWKMAAAFGLLHGMGFAGALAEIGLPQGEILPALVSFNAGIELGQLAFVAVVLVLGRATGAREALSLRVPAYVIGTLAAFWIFERTAQLLRLGG